MATIDAALLQNYHLRGIANRLAQNWQAAKSDFKRALQLATNDPIKQAGIQRDYAMMFIAQLEMMSRRERSANNAQRLFQQAEMLLQASYVVLQKTDKVEAAVTLGFQGANVSHSRIYITGETRFWLKAADAVLQQHDNATYELINLLMLMRASSIAERWHLYRRVPLSSKRRDKLDDGSRRTSSWLVVIRRW